MTEVKDAEMFWSVLSANNTLPVLKNLDLEKIIVKLYDQMSFSACMRLQFVKVLYYLKQTASLNVYNILVDILRKSPVEKGKLKSLDPNFLETLSSCLYCIL